MLDLHNLTPKDLLFLSSAQFAVIQARWQLRHGLRSTCDYAGHTNPVLGLEAAMKDLRYVEGDTSQPAKYFIEVAASNANFLQEPCYMGSNGVWVRALPGADVSKIVKSFGNLRRNYEALCVNMEYFIKEVNTEDLKFALEWAKKTGIPQIFTVEGKDSFAMPDDDDVDCYRRWQCTHKG